MKDKQSIYRLLSFFLILYISGSHIGCRADESDGADSLSNANTDTTDDDDAWYEEWPVGAHGVKAYYIVPKISSFFSMLGSSAIIAEVVVEQKKYSRRSSPSIGGLLISMSVSDIFFSATFFVGNWAIPTDATYIWHRKGNTASCDAQGFFYQLGWAATPLFSLALSIYFLLIVRYNWTEGQLSKLNPWVHGSIWLLSLLMAVIPVPLGLYNASYEVCWLEATPYDCSLVDDDWWPCTRGHQAAEWALVYFIFPALVCLFLSMIVMGMLYQTVRQMETDRMTNVLQTGAGQEIQLNSVDRKRSRKVGMQAIHYLSVYFFVFVPEFIVHIFASVNDEWFTYWTDLIVYAIVVPLLGFFNFLVFASRRDQMYTSYGRFLSRAFCCFGITGVVLRQTTGYLSSRVSSGHPSGRGTNNNDRSTQHCNEKKQAGDFSSASAPAQ